jgi:NIMA (never in mitosis gene a)-related kinase 11
VTEYCEGGDLDQRLKELKKKDGRLEESQVVEWLIQILLAVQYMHKSRVLHRDLKARNIFLKSNQVKIGDFGISRILVGTMDVASTFTGTPYALFLEESLQFHSLIHSTRYYMSPEVMKHDGYESKSDIW